MTTTLTFDDEFNSLSLWNGTSGTWDTAAPYVPLNGNGYSLPTNGEQEWYINSNYAPTSSVQPWSVNNGVLTLSAAPASAAIQPLINGYQYTSGVINTSQSFTQTYGFFEMRAELPAGQGLWPAFWLLPENGSWPPEIDAMEMLGNDPSTYYTSVHSGTSSDEVSAGQADSVANTSTGFHTYGVDWEPNEITYYFDGKEVYQTPTPSDMNTPMYMIANLAVGGGWPGDANSTTPFPANMQIDFIRAYSSLPSWIADGSDPTDVNHTPAGTVASVGGTGSESSNSGSSVPTASSEAASGSSGIVPTTTAAAYYTVPSNIQEVVMTGTTAQTVTANNLGDTITANDAASTIIGGTGNDTLIAGHGADVLTGGAGDNTFVFNVLPWNAGHVTDFNPATDTLNLTGIFTSIGYTGTNPIAGGYLSFVSDGSGDTLVYVNSHSASDPWPTLITTLEGVSPSSITSSDYIFSASESLSSSGSSGDGDGSAAGAAAVDTAAASYTVPSNVLDVVMTGTTAQTVTANNLGDTITANDAASTIVGGAGNDTLIAGHGADTLTGGGGHDTFVFDYLPWNAGHITDFNTASDVLNLSGIFTSMGYAGSNPVADGYLEFIADGSGDTQVFVNSHNDSDPWLTLITTLNGVSPSSITSSDYTFSSTGTETSSTPTNATSIDTSAANFSVPAGDLDVVMTGTAAQKVTANNLGDTITANDAASTIIGGTGNDILIAGHGADTLTGGGGHDTFVFNSLPWNAGQITDFNTATDTLNLSGIFTSIGYTGSNPIADGYLSFTSDGAGNTKVYVDPQGSHTTIPILITTLDHVSPSSIAASDWMFHVA